MSASFLVWRLCDGYSNASTFEASGFEDAACKAHNNDHEYDTEETFCVQAKDGDRKVCVLTSERELVPEYNARRFEPAALKERCACGTRLFDSDGHGNQCRRCWLRANAEQIEMERAQ